MEVRFVGCVGCRFLFCQSGNRKYKLLLSQSKYLVPTVVISVLSPSIFIVILLGQFE